jgi:hypothetical protein
MKSVNERSTVVLVVTFSDENKALVTPTNAKYQIKDENTGTILTPWTALTVVSSSYTLVIDQNNNRIFDDSNDSEVKIVTVVSQYSTPTKQCTSEFKYEVKNLHGVPVEVVLDVTGGVIIGGNMLLT